MMILHGPAVLAVNVLSPSSLLSSWGPGPLAIVFAETGRAGQGPRALIAPHLACRRFASGSPPGRTGLADARPRMTVYIRARCGGQPKGARCLP
ncbi:MAG TPA: hypothetical protein VJ305_11395 [Streptosporangiaceae bacterium]|jgi:hypothetical protein|nr:hypothetical protein [Streptosporangiaceae bacterium]